MIGGTTEFTVESSPEAGQPPASTSVAEETVLCRADIEVSKSLQS